MTMKTQDVISSITTKIIQVAKLAYWDGSKFMARLDKPDSLDVLARIRVTMKARFANLSPMDQRKLAREWSEGKGCMVVRKVVHMREEEYNKSEKLKE